MPFVSIPGMSGKMYVPEKRPGSKKKFPCKDCFSCEQCSDDRCRVCREKHPPAQISEDKGK
ncbi:MAG: hypothetical protein R6V15_01875 [Desulfotignum sp.]